MLNFSELGFGVALLYIRFPESESDFLCAFCSSKRNLNRAATSQCHLVNGTGRREEHKMLRHHAFAR